MFRFLFVEIKYTTTCTYCTHSRKYFDILVYPKGAILRGNGAIFPFFIDGNPFLFHQKINIDIYPIEFFSTEFKTMNYK